VRSYLFQANKLQEVSDFILLIRSKGGDQGAGSDPQFLYFLAIKVETLGLSVVARLIGGTVPLNCA
jgi:hypothetical protein